MDERLGQQTGVETNFGRKRKKKKIPIDFLLFYDDCTNDAGGHGGGEEIGVFVSLRHW